MHSEKNLAPRFMRHSLASALQICFLRLWFRKLNSPLQNQVCFFLLTFRPGSYVHKLTPCYCPIMEPKYTHTRWHKNRSGLQALKVNFLQYLSEIKDWINLTQEVTLFVNYSYSIVSMIIILPIANWRFCAIGSQPPPPPPSHLDLRQNMGFFILYGGYIWTYPTDTYTNGPAIFILNRW